MLLGLVIAPAERAAAQAVPAMNVAAAPSAARGPLARLVRNPDTADGLSPYALADQAGTIQRYVEPVSGIDLEPYVGTIVTVRNDTGRTLLASQLDLPDSPAVVRGSPDPALAGQRGDLRSRQWQGRETMPQLGRLGALLSGVRQAQHVEPLAPDGVVSGEPMPPDPVTPSSKPPSWAVSAPPSGVEPIYLDSMSPDMGMTPGMGPSPEMGPCPSSPSCGSYCDTMGCGSMIDGSCMPARTACSQPDPWRLYAAADLSFLRVRAIDGVFVDLVPIGGKLSEHYDFSPRVIVGVTNSPLLDARVRYWRYHETTRILDGGDVRFEFDVLDVEATSRLQGRRTDVVLAGGVRLADLGISINIPEREESDEVTLATGSDLIGVTLAADVQTRIFSNRFGQVGVVYGGRLSLLGGDWGGQLTIDGEPFDVSSRDDNILVHEFYGGVEYLYCFRNFDVHARFTAEWQNWHSDTLDRFFLFESIGFFGPSAQVGITF
jgi:hypothetical protein